MLGVNQRRPNSSPQRTRKAVSARFISRATNCIQSSLRGASRMQTAAGLPAKARSVKASTVTMGVGMQGKKGRKGERGKGRLLAPSVSRRHEPLDPFRLFTQPFGIRGRGVEQR